MSSKKFTAVKKAQPIIHWECKYLERWCSILSNVIVAPESDNVYFFVLENVLLTRILKVEINQWVWLHDNLHLGHFKLMTWELRWFCSFLFPESYFAVRSLAIPSVGLDPILLQRLGNQHVIFLHIFIPDYLQIPRKHKSESWCLKELCTIVMKKMQISNEEFEHWGTWGRFSFSAVLPFWVP